MIRSIQIIDNAKPIINSAVRGYCTLPYPGHPKGCPMFGKRPECPPQAPRFFDYFDTCDPFTAIVFMFDLGHHAARMKYRHPEWSDRQCRNPLYWQGGIRKALKFQCKRIAKRGQDFTLIPEAMGMDVIATMRQHDIIIEFPVRDIVKKVAFIGTVKK